MSDVLEHRPSAEQRPGADVQARGRLAPGLCPHQGFAACRLRAQRGAVICLVRGGPGVGPITKTKREAQGRPRARGSARSGVNEKLRNLVLELGLLLKFPGRPGVGSIINPGTGITFRD
jgi:hypothetical protein